MKKKNNARSTKQPKSATFSAEDIVKDVKLQLKTAGDLYERYIDANSTFNIDPVINPEFLKDGWSDNLVHKDTVVKEVENTFSFVINLNNAKELIINAAIKGDDLYLKPIELTLRIGKQVLNKVTLHYNHFSKYTFEIPPECRKEHMTITGELVKSSLESSIVVRSIIAVNAKVLSDSWGESLFELENIKRDSTQLLQFLEWHKNPEMLLPGGNRKSTLKKVAKKVIEPFFRRFSDSLIIKRVVLKLIRPFTTPQILFNQYLLEIIKLQQKRNDKLEELLVTSLESSKKQQNEKNTSVR